MPTETKITRAYCIELEKNLTINEAYYESTKNGLPHKKLSFLCTDKNCQERGVKIIGVVYDKLPSERKVVPYFRRDHKGIDHHNECEWFLNHQYYAYENMHENETEDEAKIRRIKYKLNDIIELYDPSSKKTIKTEESDLLNLSEKLNYNYLKETKQNEDFQKRLYRNSTTVFNRLVQHHYDLQKTFTSIEDFKKIKLYVVGIGETTWFEYFRVVKYISLNNQDKMPKITFGWINKNIKRYKTGFKIYLISKINNHSVSLYIPSIQIDKYKHRKHILDILEKKDTFSKITAYFIFDSIDLVHLQSGIYEYQITIHDLSKFSLVTEK